MSLLLVLSAVVLPGFVLVRAAVRRPPTLLALLTLPLAVGTVFATVVAVLLVCYGRLSIGSLLVAEGALLLPVLKPALARGGPRLGLVLREARRRRREYLLLLLLVVAAVATYRRPSEWVLSEGHDAANYLVQAAYHTRQPSAFPADAAPEVYARDFAHATYRLNSTVGPPGLDGRRQFPFPPFFKALLAAALLVGGVPLALHVPLYLGVLATLCAHLALARLVRRRSHAVLGAALMLGSPLLLQFMRITVSEVCMLFVATTAQALLHAADTRAGGAMAGFVLSLVLLVRADGLLLYAGVVGVLVAGGLGRALRVAPGVPRSFGLAFLWGAAAAWSVALHTSSHYLLAHLGRMGPWVPGALTTLAMAYSLALLGAGRCSARVLAARAQVTRYAPRAGAAALAMWVTYALVARPLWLLALWLLAPDAPLPVLPGQPGGAAAVVLGYVTTLTTLAGAAGAVLLLWTGPGPWLPWTGTFLVGAFVYLGDLHHSPAPYWASRRLLCTVLPLCVAGSVWLLERWVRRGGRARGVRLLAAGLVAANLVVHNARLTAGRGIDYVGAAASLDTLANAYQATDVVLVDGALAGAEGLRLGLRYLHGIEALAPDLATITDEELVAFWRRQAGQGRRLHVLPGSAAAAVRLGRLFVVERAELELRYEHWRAGGVEPHRVGLGSLRITECRRQPSARATRARLPAPALPAAPSGDRGRLRTRAAQMPAPARPAGAGS